jgi:hypothetical protein
MLPQELNDPPVDIVEGPTLPGQRILQPGVATNFVVFCDLWFEIFTSDAFF